MGMYSDLENEYHNKTKQYIIDTLIYVGATALFIIGIALFVVKDTGTIKKEQPRLDLSIAESPILTNKSIKNTQVIIPKTSQDVYMSPDDFTISKDKFDKLVAEVEAKLEALKPLDVENPFANVQYQVIPNMTTSDITNEDYEILLRIVESEAGGEDDLGKRLVAYTILNRVASKQFPNTIKEVVFATNSKGGYEYTPISNGRYFKVTPSANTKKAVDIAINNFNKGIDESNGSTFFMAPHLVGVDPSATSNGVRWQQENLEFVMSHGTHEFRKYPNH